MLNIIHYCGSIDIRVPLGLFGAVACPPPCGLSTYKIYYAKGRGIRLACDKFMGAFWISTVSVCSRGVYLKESNMDYDDIGLDLG